MSRHTFRLTALSAALASAYGTAFAQAEDAELAALIRPESEVSVGLGYWSKDRPRLGTYDGMNQKGAYGLLDAFINSRDERSGTWFILEGRNLGLDTRELRADWLRQGDFGVSLEYGRTPRDEPYTVLTGVRGIGSSTQRVPTPSASTLGGVHLGTMREAFGAGFNKFLSGGYDFRVNVKSEDKTGDRLWGRGGAAEFAAEPLDSNTRQIDAALSYTSQAFQIQGGYYGSWYTNRISMVDTALISPAGVTSSPFFLSQPLDNQAHQIFANGGYNFTERTRATFKVAYTRATQDEQIPVGPGVAVSSTAPTSLDGRLDTTLLQAGLTQRTTNEFSWLASLRSYDSDEKTPQHRVVGPACPGCVDTTPLTFKTLTGKLEGTYRFRQGLSVTGGLDHSKQDRNVPVGDFSPAGFDNQRYVPFRAELDETTYRVEARRSLSETLNGRIALAHSKRDGSELTPGNEPQVDLINPIHIADRDRNKIRLMLDWTPIQPLTLTFNADYAKDEYGHSDARPYGLRDGKAQLYSLDAAYAINENWSLSAWYTRDQAEANQFGQRAATTGAGEAVKEANLEDVGDTFGLGVRGRFTPQLKAGVDLLYQKNVNKYPETITLTGPGSVFPVSGGVTAAPLPDITNKLMRVNLHAVYALQKNAEVRVDYVYERWETDDWSWMFADGTPFTYGTTTDGTQVVQAAKQNASFIGARYIYRFQ
jgi:MtrB/PioB family decaheme-associated outer membrane protein